MPASSKISWLLSIDLITSSGFSIDSFKSSETLRFTPSSEKERSKSDPLLMPSDAREPSIVVAVLPPTPPKNSAKAESGKSSNPNPAPAPAPAPGSISCVAAFLVLSVKSKAALSPIRPTSLAVALVKPIPPAAPSVTY